MHQDGSGVQLQCMLRWSMGIETQTVRAACRLEVIGHVCQALDFMHDRGQVFGERYNLHGPSDRRFGSHGLVQHASIRVLRVRTFTLLCNWAQLLFGPVLCWPVLLREVSFRDDVWRMWDWLCAVQDMVAIKFFTDPVGFANEHRAYNIKSVAEAVGMSPIFMDNDDCSSKMPNGLPFPPYTVTEKGQPLDVWMERHAADPITSMQVLMPVASITAAAALLGRLPAACCRIPLIHATRF